MTGSISETEKNALTFPFQLLGTAYVPSLVTSSNMLKFDNVAFSWQFSSHISNYSWKQFSAFKASND